MPETSRLRRRAQFAAAVAELNLQRYDEAFKRWQQLATETPASEIFNNLGVVQLRRGANPQTGKATYYFNKAVELNHCVRRLHLQSGLRLLGGAGLPGSRLLAARGGPATTRGRRRAFRAGRGVEGDQRGHRGRPRARAGAPAVGRIRRRDCRRRQRSYQNAWSGFASTSSALAPREPISVLTSTGAARPVRAGGLSPRSRPAILRARRRPERARPNCSARSICRPIRPRRICSSAACTCGPAVRRTPSTR